jgi:hypothetical protein
MEDSEKLILLNMVASILPFCQFASSRLIGMEIIRQLSDTLFVVPYLVTFIK